MKLKGSIKGIYPDTVFIIFAVSALIAVPVRVFQFMGILDPATGFWADKTSVTIPVIYSVLAASVLIMLLFSYLSGSMPKTKAPSGKNPALAIASGLMSLSLIADCCSCIIAYLATDSKAQSALTAGNATTPLLFQSIFAGLGAIFFLVYAISFISGNELYKRVGVLSAAVVAWLMCRMIHRFTRAIGFLNVSELTFELFMVSFLMLFFLAFARLSNGINTDKRLWSILGFGFSGALFGLVCFIPRAVTALIGGSLIAGSPIEYCDLASALFIIIFNIAVFSEKQEERAPVTASEVKAEQPKKEEIVEQYEMRAQLEEMQRRQRDQEAFKIAAEFAGGELGSEAAWQDAVNRYTSEDLEATQLEDSSAPASEETGDTQAE